MKKISFLLLFLFVSVFGMAQQKEALLKPKIACTDSFLHHDMVTRNHGFIADGYAVKFFKKIPFERKMLVPERIKLEKGHTYQINFVANRSFNNMSMILIGKEKRKFFKIKKKRHRSKQYWISKRFVASYTGYYWIILSQKAKGKDVVCGGLSVLELMTR